MKQFKYLIFILLETSAFAQTDSDLSLIKQYKRNYASIHLAQKATYLFKDKNAFIKYNPISLTFGGTLFLYQRVVSPQVSAGCAYEISCSNYSKQCIKHFGLVKGLALTTDRLTRCNRIASADFHPIFLTRHNKMIDFPEMYRLKK